MNIRPIWVIAPIALVLTAGAGMVLADRDDYRGGEYGEHGFLPRWMVPEPMAYNTQQNPIYEEECGSCHFPFQPGFLPAESWQEIMDTLDDHFGENAELGDERRQQITEFLLANAAGRVNGEIPGKVMWSLRYTPNPKRITETAFFRHEHHEIPPWILQQQERQLSFANCDSCHTRARQGSYREREIRIPGVGRWDD